MLIAKSHSALFIANNLKVSKRYAARSNGQTLSEFEGIAFFGAVRDADKAMSRFENCKTAKWRLAVNLVV